jgi:hypothetical protein
VAWSSRRSLDPVRFVSSGSRTALSGVCVGEGALTVAVMCVSCNWAEGQGHVAVFLFLDYGVRRCLGLIAYDDPVHGLEKYIFSRISSCAACSPLFSGRTMVAMDDDG